MTSDPWRRRALGWFLERSRRALPRLERSYSGLPSAGIEPGSGAADHEARLLRYYRQLAATVAEVPHLPTFSILLADGPAQFADESLAALRLQILPPVEVLRRPFPKHVRGDVVVPLQPGDRPYPSALAELARAWHLEQRLTGSDPVALYSDEQPIDEAGLPTGPPLHKPGWSPRLLRSGPYVGGLIAVSRQAVADWSTWNAEAGCQALASMTSVPHVLVERRHPPVLGSPPPISAPHGRVSIIIPTRDAADLLAACLRSIRLVTEHPDLEIVVVDNDTTDPAALAVLRDHANSGGLVVPDPGPFNFARSCNRGIAASSGDVVIVLNNDTEVRAPQWVSALASWCADPGVGAVGGLLTYPDGRVQHAGLVGLADAGTGHAFVAADPGQPVALNLLRVPHEVIAVTGACLAVSRAKWDAVGGLDEELFTIEAGDVDLCLRLRERGWVSVIEPRAELLHHESPSRRRAFDNFERFALQRRWPAELLTDPYLNPNLAKSTKLQPDLRFGAPTVPPKLFAAWLAAGSLSLPGTRA